MSSRFVPKSLPWFWGGKKKQLQVVVHPRMASLLRRSLQCHTLVVSPKQHQASLCFGGLTVTGVSPAAFLLGDERILPMEGRREGVSAAEAFQFPVFCPSQWLPAPRVGRIGGAAPLCTSSSAPASPGGCAGMASSTAWAGPTSSSALPDPDAPPCWGQRDASHTSPWSLGLMPCHPLGKLQPKQILPSSKRAPSRDRGRVTAPGWTLAVGQLPGVCCHVKVTLPSRAALTGCSAGDASLLQGHSGH